MNCTSPESPKLIKTSNITSVIEKDNVSPRSNRRGYVSPLRSSCPKSFDIIEKRLDYSKLHKALASEKTLSFSLHDNLRCVIESIISKPGDPGTNIGNWIAESKLIGEESAFGYAFSVTPKNQIPNRDKDSAIVVIKTLRNVKDVKDDLPHEAFVGLYCINELRRHLPNFMFTYGYTQCSGYSPIQKRKLCSQSGSISHLILENIMNSSSIYRFIKKSFIDEEITSTDIIKIFAQLFGALKLAQEKFNFKHGDLHLGNILIREFKEEIAVSVYLGNGRFATILTQYVPYIIDFGMARVRKDGIEFKPTMSQPGNDEDYLMEKVILYFRNLLSRHGESEFSNKITQFGNRIIQQIDFPKPNGFIALTLDILIKSREIYEYEGMNDINEKVYDSCLFTKEFTSK